MNFYQRYILVTLAIWFGLLTLATAQERPEVIEAYRNDPYGESVLRKTGIMDGNLVRTLYINQGEVGQWPNQPSGEWPKGTGHSYLDGVCLLVGARVLVDVNGAPLFITPIETAYREHFDRDPVTGEPWGWEPVPGYLNPSGDRPAVSNDPRSWPTLWPDAVFVALDQPSANWINQAEVNGEAGVDDDRDGVIDNFTYWHGFFGRGVKNADLETYFVIDDSKDREWSRAPYNYYPIKDDSARGGLGLRVEVRGFQWSHVLAEDVVFWLYDITNTSDIDYDKISFGMVWPGIGSHSPSFQSRTTPPGWASSSGVSCRSGAVTMSVLVSR